MKMQKVISLDVDLVSGLQKSGLNVSEYCNEKLWTYLTKIENDQEPENVKIESIEERMVELEKKKNILEKTIKAEEEMKEAGITKEHIKFLTNMNENIMTAKDTKENWKRKFRKEIKWDELIKLKKKWT